MHILSETELKAISIAFSRYDIPMTVHDGLMRYLQNRVLPGGFLTAVLENDLAAAVLAADKDNLPALPNLVKFIWNELPANAWGSKKHVFDWVNH